ncbi:stalled ribosome rescue protein Dom34 [Bradyrhizobium sp. GM6.1]
MLRLKSERLRLVQVSAPLQPRYPLLRKWTEEQHQRLKAMAEAGNRPDEIAIALGRSEAAVRVRAWQHGIPLRLVTKKRK